MGADHLMTKPYALAATVVIALTAATLSGLIPAVVHIVVVSAITIAMMVFTTWAVGK